MQVKAIGRGLHLSPQKARLVVDMVRGLHVAQALDVLSYTPKKGAPLVKKILQSAIDNAENNEGADVDDLRIAEIFVGEGIKMKRTMPRAKGRADRIVKRTCHITVAVSDE